MEDSPDPAVVAASVEAQVSATRGRVGLAAGIGGEFVTDPMAVVRQVEAAREQGADGFVLLAASEAIDDQLAALRAGATAEGTWPAYLSPPVEWTFTGGMERKDAPLAFPAGDRAQLDVRIINQSPLKVPIRVLEAQLRLEDTEGRLLDTIVPL